MHYHWINWGLLYKNFKIKQVCILENIPSDPLWQFALCKLSNLSKGIHGASNKLTFLILVQHDGFFCKQRTYKTLANNFETQRSSPSDCAKCTVGEPWTWRFGCSCKWETLKSPTGMSTNLHLIVCFTSSKKIGFKLLKKSLSALIGFFSPWNITRDSFWYSFRIWNPQSLWMDILSHTVYLLSVYKDASPWGNCHKFVVESKVDHMLHHPLTIIGILIPVFRHSHYFFLASLPMSLHNFWHYKPIVREKYWSLDCVSGREP